MCAFINPLHSSLKKSTATIKLDQATVGETPVRHRIPNFQALAPVARYVVPSKKPVLVTLVIAVTHVEHTAIRSKQYDESIESP